MEIIIPNIITPNDDGLNDELTINWRGNLTVVETYVYNRWGELLFESTFPGVYWDGRTFAGSPVPDGTYFVILRYTTTAGETVEHKSTITVLH